VRVPRAEGASIAAPEGRLIIARRFNAGAGAPRHSSVPSGTAEIRRGDWVHFSRAYGTGSDLPPYPALKRRATINRPSGT